jgi:hypothetical protein
MACKDPEKEKARILAWKKANPEKVKARAAKWYKDNSEKVKAWNSAYRKANPEKNVLNAAKRYNPNAPQELLAVIVMKNMIRKEIRNQINQRT